MSLLRFQDILRQDHAVWDLDGQDVWKIGEKARNYIFSCGGPEQMGTVEENKAIDLWVEGFREVMPQLECEDIIIYPGIDRDPSKYTWRNNHPNSFIRLT